jgi:hypothetical protein
MLQARPADRLGKALVDVVSDRADMRIEPVGNLPALFVLVEAEIEKGSRQTAVLRGAVHQRVLNRALQRVGQAGLAVAQ